jgi:hypothetical protein
MTRLPFESVAFSDFEPLNAPNLDELNASLAKKGPRLVSDVPESLKYADVIEHRGLRVFGVWLYRKSRKVRLFLCVFLSSWSYLTSGIPTPGHGVESLEVAYVARTNAIQCLDPTFL